MVEMVLRNEKHLICFPEARKFFEGSCLFIKFSSDVFLLWKIVRRLMERAWGFSKGCVWDGGLCALDCRGSFSFGKAPLWTLYKGIRSQDMLLSKGFVLLPLHKTPSSFSCLTLFPLQRFPLSKLWSWTRIRKKVSDGKGKKKFWYLFSSFLH